jgi:hypothetical protein
MSMAYSTKKIPHDEHRRIAKHTKPGNPLVLPDWHRAVVEGRPYFSKGANDGRWAGRLLISGENQRKLGKKVTKGKWKDAPIFALTLEERATCPRDCDLWNSCYGNRMPWSIRHHIDDEKLFQLANELSDLQHKHWRTGFVIRLHVLGDFFSAEYVEFWRRCLKTFPGLRVFGYTARWHDEIGMCLAAVIRENWDRFAVRSSGAKMDVPASRVVDRVEDRGDGIICPVQTERAACCATCGLCWHSKRDIVFLRH